MKEPVQAVAQFHEPTGPSPTGSPMDRTALLPAALLLFTISFGLGLLLLAQGAP